MGLFMNEPDGSLNLLSRYRVPQCPASAGKTEALLRRGLYADTINICFQGFHRSATFLSVYGASFGFRRLLSSRCYTHSRFFKPRVNLRQRTILAASLYFVSVSGKAFYINRETRLRRASAPHSREDIRVAVTVKAVIERGQRRLKSVCDRK